MQLYFIRHAQSENNAHWGDKSYQESDDPELTELAHSQVAHLARYLGAQQQLDANAAENSQNRHGFGLTHLYTSLMIRAVRTADPVAQATGLPLVAWPEIHETGGVFSRLAADEMAGLPGKRRSFFEADFPKLTLPDSLDENGWWRCRPFESYAQRQPRAEKVWAELLARHGDRAGQAEQRVAVVSHGGFFMHLLAAALQIDLRRTKEYHHDYWFLMNNCGITRFDVSDERVLLAYVNRTDFLPDDLIT